jgi:type IV pilus assembly protein PilC
MSTATLARTYTYQGRDATGKLTKGRIEAPNQATVVSRMRGMGLAPVRITEAAPNTGLNREIKLEHLIGSRVKLKDITVMARQMATMIAAGLSLLRTLDILAEQTENKKLSGVLVQVRADLEAGSSLSDAMARHGEIFPPLMVNLVRAGETGGFLEQALDSAAKTYEKDVKLRATIKSAMAYPVVVLGMAVLAVIAMLLFIVPTFQKMFANLGGTLPLPTLVLVWLSQAMVWLVPAGAVAGVLGAIWWKRNGRTEAVRSRIDPLKLKIPVFGMLMTKLAVARFTRNLASMVAAGVPILRALGIVGDTSGNWVIERAVKNVQDSVRAGRSIAAPLANEPVFPRMVVQMIAVGEDSGALEAMLNKIADFYDDEVQAMTEALTSLIEPLLIAVIGIVVGGMIVALYLPIFNIYSLIK